MGKMKFQSRAGGHYPPTPSRPRIETKARSKSVKNKKEGGDK